MKRVLSILLVAVMLASVFVSCTTKKDDNGGQGTTTTENGSSSVSSAEAWISHGYDKLRTDSKKGDADDEYTVYLAKNETEGIQIGFRPEEDVTIRFRATSGDNDHIAWRIYHIREILSIGGRKKYTDPCVAFSRLSVERNKTAVFTLEFTTSSDTPAGDYEYEFAFTDSKGNVYASINVTVHVWGFAMPEKYAFETAVGLWRASEGAEELLLEHNMSPFVSNFDILSDEADAYMSDPRVTSFRVEDRVEDDVLVRYYEKLRTNEEWMKKAFFYIYGLDEPNAQNGRLELMEESVARVKRLCPGIRIVCPFYQDTQLTPELDQIDFMSQYIDLHCPKLSCWDEDQIYSAEQMEKYDSFDDRMKALQKRGDTLWAYVCNIPVAPYFNVQVLDEGLHSRVLFWQMYQRDVQGFLYWAVDAWTNDPYHDVDYFHSGWHGDGVMIFPETILNGTPNASIRLKIMRDGVDDIELLYMAEELFGRDWVDAKVNSVTKTLTSVEVTNDGFAAIRVQIAEAIEAELNK